MKKVTELSMYLLYLLQVPLLRTIYWEAHPRAELSSCMTDFLARMEQAEVEAQQ